MDRLPHSLKSFTANEEEMETARQKREALRSCVRTDPILIAPGAADVLTARLIESVGFRSVFLSGNLQHKMNGFADVNALTMTEMANLATMISESVGVPTIADGESGFGIGLNVKRMIREYERGGVAAILLEDSELPKRPARLGFSSPTVSRGIFLDKIKTALDARRDESLIIVARSEVRGNFDELRERLRMAAELGADAFWFSTREPEEMRALNACIDRPGFGSLPSGMTAKEYALRGARCAIVANALGIASVTAQLQLLESLKETGTPDRWFAANSGSKPAAKFFNAVGMEDI
jgi:2,3-dimethylmalate lyase